jgi:hypothetical protein
MGRSKDTSKAPEKTRQLVEVCCRGCSLTATRRKDAVNVEAWFCRACARRAVHASRQTPIGHLPIDSAATHAAFGYTAEQIGPQSQRRVMIRCVVCQQLASRKRCAVTEDAKCRHHSSTNPDLIAKKKAAIRRRFGRKGLGQPEIQQRRMATLVATYGTSRLMSLPRSTSKMEDRVRAFVASVVGHSPPAHLLPNGKSIDIYVADKKIGIEYNGLKWHHDRNEYRTSRYYHDDKRRLAEAQGIRLIQIYSDEWRDRSHAVKGFLSAVLAPSKNTVGARECRLGVLSASEAAEFLKWEHVLGASQRSKAAWGLWRDSLLVAVLTVSTHHRHTARRALVIDRLCFRKDWHVVGGAGRLVSAATAYAKDHGAEELLSWSDNRWSQGKVYAALGFVREAELPPDYQYVELPDALHRISKQSQRKTATKCPEGVTEYVWAQERNLARIWDCGKVRWVKKVNS